MMDVRFMAQQFNRFLQLTLANANLDDEKAMEVADLYPEWKPKTSYKADEIVKCGVNADNETQLYKVIQTHTSQDDWTPNTTPSLYKKIGFTDDGTSIWTQPLGSTDAYRIGDVVSHNGKLWECTSDYNVYEPGVYGWKEVNE